MREYGAEVVIRPLTDGELSRIFSVIGPVPLRQDGSPDMNNIEIEKNFEALRLATSMGLVEPQLDIKDVTGMKFGAPEYIGMKILEISGVAPPEFAKKKGGK